MSLFQPYQVSADTVRAAAEQSTAGIDQLRKIRADVEVEHRAAVSAVEGDIRPYIQAAPDPAGQYNDTIVARLSFARGAMHLFAIAIDDFNTDSDNPRSVSKLNTAYEEAAAHHFGVDAGEYAKEEDGQPTLDKTRYAGAVAAARQALIADLKAEYARLDRQLDDEAAEIAAMLKGEDPRAEDVRAMFAAGALPSYAALLFPQVDLSNTKLNRLPTDLRGMSPEQLAQHLVKEPGTFVYLGNQLKRLVPEVVPLIGREIADQLRDAKLDGKDAGEEIRRLRKRLETWQNISLDVTAAIYENLGADDTVRILTRLNRLVDATGEDPLSLARVFRQGLVLADSAWSDEQSARFGRDLSAELTRIDSGDALAYLLHNQTYSTALLDPVAARIAELDTSPTALNTAVPTGVLDGPPNVTEALFSALARNPEVALNFFSPEGSDDEDLARRHEWFLKDRTMQSREGWSDLLAALDAATTDQQNIGEQSRQHLAAGLVSSIAEYLPDNGHVASEIRDGEGTRHLAHILGTYMESINDHMTGFEPDAERGAAFSQDKHGVASPYFQLDELKSLVKLAVSNPEGIAAMREGVSAFQNLALARDLADGSISEATLRDDARLEGFFMDCVGEQEIAEAKDKAQRVAAWVDLGKDLVGLVPLPGADELGELGAASLSFLAGHATSAGGDAFLEAFAGSPATEWESTTDASIYAHEARQVELATQLAAPGGDHKPLITNAELRDAADGYPPEVIEAWFGTPDNPRVLSPEEISALPEMGEGSRDQYEKLLKDVLKAKLPAFGNGAYWDTYKVAHQGFFDENFEN